jgi:large subunit ribosomal protein L19
MAEENQKENQNQETSEILTSESLNMNQEVEGEEETNNATGEAKNEDSQNENEKEQETAIVLEKEDGIVAGNLKKDLPMIKQGDFVKVFQRIKEIKDGKTKERIQVFEGQVLAVKHGRGINSTITVRKIIDGIGVEKIFPIHSPIIEKIEIVKQTKTRRAKLYYLRRAKGKKAKLKTMTRNNEQEDENVNFANSQEEQFSIEK